jgi:hypothetical protein
LFAAAEPEQSEEEEWAMAVLLGEGFLIQCLRHVDSFGKREMKVDTPRRLFPRHYAEAQGRWLARAPVVLAEEVPPEEAAKAVLGKYPVARALLWRGSSFPRRWLAPPLAAHDDLACFLLPAGVLTHYGRAVASVASPQNHKRTKRATVAACALLVDVLERARGDDLRAYGLGGAPGNALVVYLPRDTRDLVVYRSAADRETTAIEADLVLTALRLAAAALAWLGHSSGRVRVASDDAWLVCLDRDQRKRHVLEWGRDRLASTVLRPFAWPPPGIDWSPGRTMVADLAALFPSRPETALPALWDEAAAKRLVLGSSPDYRQTAVVMDVLRLGGESDALLTGMASTLGQILFRGSGRRQIPLFLSLCACLKPLPLILLSLSLCTCPWLLPLLTVHWRRFDTSAADWPVLCAKVGLAPADALPWNLYVGNYEHPLGADAADIVEVETAEDRRRIRATLADITRHLGVICFVDGLVNVIQ